MAAYGASTNTGGHQAMGSTMPTQVVGYYSDEYVSITWTVSGSNYPAPAAQPRRPLNRPAKPRKFTDEQWRKIVLWLERRDGFRSYVDACAKSHAESTPVEIADPVRKIDRWMMTTRRRPSAPN